MKYGRYITGCMVAAVWTAAAASPMFAYAQKGGFRPFAQQHQATPPAARPQAHVQAAQPPAVRPGPARPLQQGRLQATRPHQGHAGDWLRQYKDLSPAEQERALQSDPNFHRLTPERQQLLRERLQRFSSLPPQQQLHILNRMEIWEHLTPEQKRHALQFRAQMSQLPPDRQRMVRKAVEDMRSMPPDQREHIIDSGRFKGEFSDQEREMIRGAARLPLAPAEGEGASPQ